MMKYKKVCIESLGYTLPGSMVESLFGEQTLARTHENPRYQL